MTTQLAFGYRVAGAPRRDPGVSPSAAHVTEHDAIDARPPIPQGVVVDWSPDDVVGPQLPLGAGDPAAGIPGPPPFAPLRTRVGRTHRTRDGLLLGGLSALVLALAVTVGWQFGQPSQDWVARPDDARVPGNRTPVVEARVIAIEPATEPPVTLATRRSTASEN